MKINFYSFFNLFISILAHEGSINDLNNNIIYPEPAPLLNNHLRPYPKYIINDGIEQQLPRPPPKNSLRGNNEEKNKQISLYYNFIKFKRNKLSYEQNNEIIIDKEETDEIEVIDLE